MKPDTGSFAYGTPDCHGSNNDCEPELWVEAELMRSCFEWDGPTQSWPPGTPQVVLEQCPNPDIVGQYCTFDFDIENDVECDNVCGACIPLQSNEPADTGAFPLESFPVPDDTCCECDVALTGLDDLIDALDLCGFAGNEIIDCPDPEWILQSESECDYSETTTTGFAMAPGANFVLYIDPLESYISLTTTGGNQTFAVAGGGTAKTSAEKFMTATLWPADGTLAGSSFADWVFWTSAPIDYDASSGNFTVYAAQAPVFYGRGFIDSDPTRAGIAMDNNASGNVNASAETWTANYSQTRSCLTGRGLPPHLVRREAFLHDAGGPGENPPVRGAFQAPWGAKPPTSQTRPSGSKSIQVHLEGTLDVLP